MIGAMNKGYLVSSKLTVIAIRCANGVIALALRSGVDLHYQHHNVRLPSIAALYPTFAIMDSLEKADNLADEWRQIFILPGRSRYSLGDRKIVQW